MPCGACPNVSVEGRIELEWLDDVLHLDRPTQVWEGSLIGLSRSEADGKHGTRVRVRIGAKPVNTVEIRSGLGEGERVILSDMSAWDAHDRIRLDCGESSGSPGLRKKQHKAT